MILGDRSLYDLSLSDFQGLIDNRVPEGPHLDYKATAYSGHPPDIREMLRDVIAMANAGGGYIVMGIHEDGFSRPVDFSPVDDLVVRTNSIARACIDGVQERIDNLEVNCYETAENEGIIVIHVPASEKTPHMVSMDHHSDFYRRYGTNKHVMTIGEIRDSFVESPFFRRLADIQYQAQQASTRAESATYLQILTERSVERFLHRYMSSSGQQVLLIISPFIGNLEGEAYKLSDVINKTQSEKGRVYVITREPQESYHKEGLAVLEQGESVEIRYNPDVHAKLYVSWNLVEEESFAMFGSGNLTSSGINYNLELGMIILSRGYGRKLVRELYHWGNNLRTQSQKIKTIVIQPI